MEYIGYRMSEDMVGLCVGNSVFGGWVRGDGVAGVVVGGNGT